MHNYSCSIFQLSWHLLNYQLFILLYHLIIINLQQIHKWIYIYNIFSFLYLSGAKHKPIHACAKHNLACLTFKRSGSCRASMISFHVVLELYGIGRAEFSLFTWKIVIYTRFTWHRIQVKKLHCYHMLHIIYFIYLYKFLFTSVKIQNI